MKDARSLSLALLAATAGSAAGAESLPYEEMLALLPGSWEVDPTWAGEAHLSFYRADDLACDREPGIVRIVRDSEGDFYSATRADGEVTVVRAPLTPLPTGIGMGRDRSERASLDNIVWTFVMPDPDHLAMATAEDPQRIYPMLRRCYDGPVA